MRMSFVSLGVLSSVLLLSACQAGNYGSSTDTDTNGLGGPNVPETDPEFAYGKSALGVKNYLQIYESMWSATKLEDFTGLPRTDGTFNNVRNFYNSNKGTLPSSNKIESFTASHMLSISNMAWEFCDRVLEVQAVRSQFFAGTTFTALDNNGLHQPTVALGSAALRESLAEAILNQLWGEEVVATSGRAGAVDELSALALELMTGANADAQSTRNIAKGVCTAALSSAAVNLF